MMTHQWTILSFSNSWGREGGLVRDHYERKMEGQSWETNGRDAASNKREKCCKDRTSPLLASKLTLSLQVSQLLLEYYSNWK